MEKNDFGHVYRKYLILLAQLRAFKEIRSGKQSTIIRALRAGKAQGKGHKLFFCLSMLMGLGEAPKSIPLKGFS